MANRKQHFMLYLGCIQDKGIKKSEKFTTSHKYKSQSLLNFLDFFHPLQPLKTGNRSESGCQDYAEQSALTHPKKTLQDKEHCIYPQFCFQAFWAKGELPIIKSIFGNHFGHKCNHFALRKNTLCLQCKEIEAHWIYGYLVTFTMNIGTPDLIEKVMSS